MSSCENCGSNFRNAMISQNKNSIKNILLLSIHYNLPSELCNVLLSFLCSGYHTVSAQYKVRMPYPEATGDPEEDEDLEERIEYWHTEAGYYYGNRSASLCRFCLIKGIECSLLNNGRLPFLRNHYHYFIQQNTQEWIEEIERISDKYILPKHYRIDFYRTNIQPQEKSNGIRVITSY